ncbi:disintegrin and metalloproteinase domain-containing protein 18-like isoform X6 [Notamacropus eugenii]|uniref:disintegrin and metalloproteinase domain-containing protein 18-like isoform X6 n=1 Tax=Notamacropus eugenii TaxID=9315 RepID=UPI003B685314
MFFKKFYWGKEEGQRRDSTASWGFQQTPLQITVPRKIWSNATEDSMEQHVAYIIIVEGKPYTLQLQKQVFLPQDFMIYTYNKEGVFHSSSSKIMMQCNYHGYVAGFPNSLVTLNTCSGLRGLLQFENISYGIEPLESTAGFEHLIYQIKNENISVPLLEENDTDIWYRHLPDNSHIGSQEKTVVSHSLPRYLEMHIIVDKALYDHMGSEMEVVTQKIIQIIGLVNTMFTQLKVTVVLSSLEFWSDKNKISTVGDANDLLHRFLAWKHKFLVLRPHDMAYLLMHSSGVKVFSSCSLNDFKHFISKSGVECLQNQPYVNPVYKEDAVCGDGFVEGDEECDCGSKKEFSKCKFRNCCVMETCKLKPSAKCGFGPCCTYKCQFQRRGKLCRPKASEECDFNDYCNGTSHECVPDTFVQNGESCRKNTAICINGLCPDVNDQCRSIFGTASRGGSFACFEEMNGRNDRFGNCGVKKDSYKPCSFDNLLCGKLVCTWPKRGLFFKRDVSVIYSRIYEDICVSIAHSIPVRPGHRDFTFVNDGTPCGPNMVCSRFSCIESRFLIEKTCNATEKCHGKGRCNNFNSCHCNTHYSPPDCKKMSFLSWGSYDDGHLAKPDTVVARGYTAAQKNWLILGFYISLPFLIITIIIVVKWDKVKELCNVEEIQSEGSLSGESSISYSASDQST